MCLQVDKYHLGAESDVTSTPRFQSWSAVRRMGGWSATFLSTAPWLTHARTPIVEPSPALGFLQRPHHFAANGRDRRTRRRRWGICVEGYRLDATSWSDSRVTKPR